MLPFSAKGGGDETGPTKRGIGRKIKAIVDPQGLLLTVTRHSANHHEVTLVQLTFNLYMTEAKPEILIGKDTQDSDPLDEQLLEVGIELGDRTGALGNAAICCVTKATSGITRVES